MGPLAKEQVLSEIGLHKSAPPAIDLPFVKWAVKNTPEAMIKRGLVERAGAFFELKP